MNKKSFGVVVKWLNARGTLLQDVFDFGAVDPTDQDIAVALKNRYAGPSGLPSAGMSLDLIVSVKYADVASGCF